MSNMDRVPPQFRKMVFPLIDWQYVISTRLCGSDMSIYLFQVRIR